MKSFEGKFTRVRGRPDSKLEKTPELPMRFEGDETVLDDLFERDPETVNVLVMLGGGARPFAGSTTLALQKAGLRDSIDYIYTLSTGTAAASHFMAGEAEKSRRMYKLMTVKGLFKDQIGPAPLVYGDRLRKVVEGQLGHIKLNREAMLLAHPEFFAGVTDLRTGDQEFVDIKKHPEWVSGMMGSAAVPTPNQIRGVEFEGRRITDGYIGNPFPIKEIVEEIRQRAAEKDPPLSPKISVFVVMNGEEQVSKYEELGATAKLYAKTVLPGRTAEKFINNQDVFNQELEWLREQEDLKWCLEWTTKHVDLFNISEREMSELFDSSEAQVSEALLRAKDRSEKRTGGEKTD